MKEIRQLDGLKGLVLHRGTKYLRHFSLDMVTRREKKKKKNRAQDYDTHSSSNTIFYDDPYLQKASALRGLKRGVTHKIERLLHVGVGMGADIGHPGKAGAHKDSSK